MVWEIERSWSREIVPPRALADTFKLAAEKVPGRFFR
jgi:hypothetical protein